MIDLIKKLLTHEASETSQQWTQLQREALIDTLLLGMYADNLLSLAENQFFDDELQELDWESGNSLSAYVSNAIHKVRETEGDEEKRNSLLQSISERLGDDQEAKRGMLRVLKALFEADEMVKEEEALLNEIEGILEVSLSDGGTPE